jgi:hypothetical protein
LYVGILFAKENWFDLLPDEPFASSDEAWGLRETAVTAPQQAAPTIRHSVKRIRNALGHGHIKVMVREGMKRKELLSKVCVAFHDFDPRKPDDTFDVTLSLENLGKMVKKFQSVIHRHVREKKAAAS